MTAFRLRRCSEVPDTELGTFTESMAKTKPMQMRQQRFEKHVNQGIGPMQPHPRLQSLSGPRCTSTRQLTMTRRKASQPVQFRGPDHPSNSGQASNKKNPTTQGIHVESEGTRSQGSVAKHSFSVLVYVSDSSIFPLKRDPQCHKPPSLLANRRLGPLDLESGSEMNRD